MKELLGHKIKHIELSPDATSIRFKDGQGQIIASYFAGADCCSESWFAEVIGCDNLCSGNPVIEVQDIDIDWTDEFSRQSVDQRYGIEIKTMSGICLIVFRNSSNGYYGGSYGIDFDRPEEKWIEVKEDWQNEEVAMAQAKKKLPAFS